ncbi:MAG: hypothetical protein A2622_10855 [Bdellovibrionales bacterium RIFCSPHIGHO2_01_FULL_40_29]|nr:MAG: hypothetical protein A2622_10855 [Bdellovibrionales bacterium RIFCSPHIGHO2_01_FULL_40_29]OFZ34597.1 MAG: hypothetical protein A3D17_01120 [Bdellovibrionales bacterium RIFCSPHIGHO2_02_FULL_40_15]
MPSQIILLRHAEEPSKAEGQFLSEKGFRRALALPSLFENKKPDILIALKPHKKNGSIRSIQTLQPLSQKLGIKLYSPFTRDEISELIQFLAHAPSVQGKKVVIAWQHLTLAEIAERLGASMAPRHWGGDIFDRYWVLDFENGQLVRFQNLPQKLLRSDSTK